MFSVFWLLGSIVKFLSSIRYLESFFSPERKAWEKWETIFFSQNPILRSTPRKARQKNRTVVESLGEEEEDFNIENDNQQAQSENNEYAIRYRCEISGFLQNLPENWVSKQSFFCFDIDNGPKKFFFRNKTFLFFKIESWNFQVHFEIEFH